MKLATLADARAYLDGFVNLERVPGFDYERLGLERVRALLRGLGDPHVGLPCVHIAGSKGKGSTALLTEALLRAGGTRVGTYTSPHLECWSERFRIDGRPVAEPDLLRALRALAPVAEQLRADPECRPSFFDVSTALALLVFRQLGVELAVVEVGLGGRIDSTNVVDARVSVITSIQLEHVDKLGATPEAIAREKAGIFRRGVPALHGPLCVEALAAVLARATAEDTPLEEVRGEVVQIERHAQTVRIGDGRLVRASVLGEHQAHNIALAVRAAEHAGKGGLSDEALGVLARVRLPARMEWFGERVVLDCAHTPDSMAALVRLLERRDPGRRRVVVTSIARDKDAAGMLHELARDARVCITCRAEPARSLPPEDLEALAWACGIEHVEPVEDPIAALERGLALAAPEDLVVVTGSVYLAGAVRRRLRETFGAAAS